MELEINLNKINKDMKMFTAYGEFMIVGKKKDNSLIHIRGIRNDGKFSLTKEDFLYELDKWYNHRLKAELSV